MAKNILDAPFGDEKGKASLKELQWKNPFIPKDNQGINTILIFIVSLIVHAIHTFIFNPNPSNWTFHILKDFLGSYIIIITFIFVISFFGVLMWNVLIFSTGKLLLLIFQKSAIVSIFNKLQTNLKLMFLLFIIFYLCLSFLMYLI